MPRIHRARRARVTAMLAATLTTGLLITACSGTTEAPAPLPTSTDAPVNVTGDGDTTANGAPEETSSDDAASDSENGSTQATELTLEDVGPRNPAQAQDAQNYLNSLTPDEKKRLLGPYNLTEDDFIDINSGAKRVITEAAPDDTNPIPFDSFSGYNLGEADYSGPDIIRARLVHHIIMSTISGLDVTEVISPRTREALRERGSDFIELAQLGGLVPYTEGRDADTGKPISLNDVSRISDANGVITVRRNFPGVGSWTVTASVPENEWVVADITIETERP